VNQNLPACLFNGQILTPEELTFPELARGFMYGDGVFETLRARNYVVFRWQEHWERMKQGLATCRIRFERTGKSVEEEIIRLLTGYQLQDAYVRVNIWRSRPDVFDPGREESGHVLIFARPFQPYPEQDYRQGLRCLVSQRFRRNENSPLSSVKSLNMLENILARLEARQSGYQDALLCNTRNYLTEATTANLFFVRDGVVCTPALACGALAGITRSIILTICRRKNLPVKEGQFPVRYLGGASEVFLTNTLMGVMPVREVAPVFQSRSFSFSQMFQEELNHLFLEETSGRHQKNT